MFKTKILKLLDILFLLVPFIDGTYCYKLVSFDIRPTYFICFLYLVCNINILFAKQLYSYLFKHIKIIIAVLFFVITISFFNIYLGNDTFLLFMKQFVMIVYVLFTTYVFFYNHRDNIIDIVKLYINISVIVALIGIFQEISYFIDFKCGYDFSLYKINHQMSTANIFLRIVSITAEPSSLVYALALSFYISLSYFVINIKNNIVTTWKSLVIILCFALTFSLIGYVGILLSLILICVSLFKNIKIYRLLIVVFLFTTLFCLGSSSFMLRINDTFNSIIDISQQNNISQQTNKTTNLSTYSILLQAKIAFTNFKEHYFIGTGLGSHSLATEKYYKLFHDNKHKLLHKGDAASLFLRLLSEFGFFGILGVILFLIYFHIPIKKCNEQLYLFVTINYGCFVYILLRLIRAGHYFSGGLFIFILLYCWSKKILVFNK